MAPALNRRTVMCLGAGALVWRSRRGLGSTRTVYVAPDGDDRNQGISPTTPFRSVAAASHAVAPGERLLLQRGGLWREALVVGCADLHVGAYGEGALPVLTGADRLGDLSRQPGTALWSTPLQTEPTQLFIEGRRAERMVSPADLLDPDQWHWGSGVLTVRGTHSAAAPNVEASVRGVCLDANGHPGVSIEGVGFRHARQHCVLLGASDAPTVRGCEIVGAWRNGIEFGTDWRHDRGLLEDNLLTGHGQTGINGGGRMSAWTIRANVVRACGQLHDQMIGSSPGHAWSAGIKIWGWARGGLQGDLVIEDNDIADCRPHDWAPANGLPHNLGNGIWIDEVVAPTGVQTIRRNHVRDCWSRGIYFEKSDRCIARHNTVFDCAQVPHTAGLSIQGNYGRGASQNVVDYNTVVGGWWAGEVSSFQGGPISDNTVSNNIFVRSPNQQLHIAGGGANVGGEGSGNVYHHNCFGPERSNFLTWTRPVSSLSAFEAAAGGAASHNVAGEPVLRDHANGDFSLGPGSLCIGSSSSGTNIGAWQG